MKFTVAITCLVLIYSCLYRHFVDGNYPTIDRHHRKAHITVHSGVAAKTANGKPQDEQTAQKYLTRAGLKISANGEGGDKWITLCTVKARVASTGFNTKHDVQRCTTTVGGEILETRVVEIENNFRCGWRTETYASNTLLKYKQTIMNQYKSAINAAAKAKESKAIIDILTEKQNLHEFKLDVATNKDTGMLEATATGLSLWRGGGSCAVKLEGRVLRLAY